jgi:hypothetical protein
MSNCSQQRKGNIFAPSLPDQGPYTGSVERVCRDDNENSQSYSRQYNTFVSNTKPENPQGIAKVLETRASNGGIFSNVANVFKSVLSGTTPRQSSTMNSSNSSNSNTYNIQEQDWPVPNVEIDQDSHNDNDNDNVHLHYDDGNRVGGNGSGGGSGVNKPSRTRQLLPKKKTRSLKRKRSIKKSVSKRRSNKKNSKPRKR